MQVLNRNLIALALGAALVAPAAFAQARLGPVAAPTVPTTSAGQATAQSAISAERPTVPTLPTQSNTRASDAVTTTTADARADAGKGNWWQAADADGDGKLSTTEANANAGLASRFASIDANKDGFVTSDEYRVFYAANGRIPAGR